MVNSLDAIVMQNLVVKYGKKTAIDNVSLSIAQGSVYALLGRNGAGKSSAIRCILGQQKPNDGKVLLFGNEAWKWRAKAMERIGVVPEEPNAPPDMTTEELVNFCSKLYKNWDNKNVQSRLQKFSIATKTRFGQLSKGQKCQVMLALALGHSPDLLVLDDPTLGLDVVARREFFEEVIGELADNGITILITTHDLPGIENIASHVGILKNGSLMVNEEMEVLKSKFRRIRYTGRGGQVAHNYTGELEPMSALDITVGHWGIEAVVSDFDDKRFDRLRMLEGLTEPEVVAMSLEEIFATVVSERTPSKK